MRLVRPVGGVVSPVVIHGLSMNDSATAKALDYSLKRWAALIRFADDGRLLVDNNWIENQIRPIAIGRKQLAVRWQLARRPACGSSNEFDAVGRNVSMTLRHQ
jgi:hypothetical protein